MNWELEWYGGGGIESEDEVLEVGEESRDGKERLRLRAIENGIYASICTKTMIRSGEGGWIGDEARCQVQIQCNNTRIYDYCRDALYALES